MGEEYTIFHALKTIIYWTTPVIFLFGVLLVLYSNYRRLEELLGEEVGGIRKRIVLALETNIFIFHEWLLEKKTLTGIACIVFAIIFFVVLR